MITPTKPNRVFFISREFNFIRDENIWNKTGEIHKLNDYIVAFLKAMVSGFGPYPIVSVKVKDKKAVVDIGQFCYLQPGIKINLDGTGVATIDTWHEIQEVTGNTYTVYIDVPDGNYTNGLTMGYPSLGWQLLDRDATRFLLRSGNSGSQSHTILAHFNPDRPTTTEYWRFLLLICKVKSEGTLSTIYDRQPVPQFAETGMPLYFEKYDTYPHSWYFYGDDAWVHMAHKTFNLGSNARHQNLHTMTLVSFGELSRGPYRNGAFIINGPWSGANIDGGSAKNYYTSGASGLYQMYFTGLAFGPTSSAKVLYLSSTNEKNGYSSYASVFSNIGYRYNRSGALTSSQANTVRYFTDNLYSAPTVYSDDDDVYIGQIPGMYFLYRQPNMTQPYVLPTSLIPVKASGKLKGRNVYALVGGDYNESNFALTGSATTINWASTSTHMLDLTGPIR